MYSAKSSAAMPSFTKLPIKPKYYSPMRDSFCVCSSVSSSSALRFCINMPHVWLIASKAILKPCIWLRLIIVRRFVVLAVLPHIGHRLKFIFLLFIFRNPRCHHKHAHCHTQQTKRYNHLRHFLSHFGQIYARLLSLNLLTFQRKPQRLQILNFFSLS